MSLLVGGTENTAVGRAEGQRTLLWGDSRGHGKEGGKMAPQWREDGHRTLLWGVTRYYHGEAEDTAMGGISVCMGRCRRAKDTTVGAGQRIQLRVMLLLQPPPGSLISSMSSR